MNFFLPFLQKFRYLAILIAVGFFAWMITWRWSRTFHPAWAWIVGALVVTVIGIVVYELVRRRHEKKMAQGLESGLSASEGEKIDLKGEIKALRENWSASLDKLKTSQGGTGGSALYRLPWYMIIGEPASGKSTLLRKSGLDFPVGDAAVRGMHGTRNCDWWFANEAIFLDTAGRYIIETQEQEWIAFLSLIAKYRKKKPISGVLVAVAANSLLTKSHEELTQDGKRIRNRIDELIDVLGVNFPVYVLVTKVDLVSGFREFFGPLDERFRDQMLGWTLPLERDARFEGETFDRKFSEVTERLYRMRPWLESQVGKRDLGKAFLFPEEFSYLDQPLKAVLEVVFKPNVYQETPVCRGVYFSSGTQVGSPLARALEDMAKDLHIPAEFGFGVGMNEEKEVRTYFIKDLVSRQIMGDRDMTWRTGASETRAKKRRMGWGMMGLGVSALLALFATSSFMTNRGRLAEFEGHLPRSGKPLEVAMGTLKAKEEAVPAGFLDAGLNYSDEVIPTIEDSFRQVTLNGLVYPPLADLKAKVDEGIPAKDGVPDVDAWQTTFGHYLYLKRAVNGELPAEMDAAAEEPHLETLMASLKRRNLAGEAGPTDLRRALWRFGLDDGFDELPEYDREQLGNRMRELEEAYAKQTDVWISRVEAFVSQRTTAEGELRRDYEAAIRGLKEACAKAEVRPHESLASLESLAREIQAKASGLSERSANQTPITDLAPNEESLVAGLKEVQERAPAGSDLAARAEKLLKPFEKKEISSTADPRQKALIALVAEIGEVMKPGPDDAAWPSRPTKDDLDRRRTDIAEELAGLYERVWKRIEPQVATLEEKPLTTEVKEGDATKQVHRPDWYDTIPLLAKARRADQRKRSYLENGLSPWLESPKWRLDRPTDPDAEVYSVSQLLEVMLPRLRDQAAFFEIADEKGLVARETARDAQAVIHAAIDRWLTDADEYWTRQFTSALVEPASTLAQVRSQLDEWKGTRPSLLMGTMKQVQTALDGLTKVSEDPRGDPVLGESESRREAIWRKWAVCFQIDDLSVYTIHRAVADLADFSQALGRVVSPLGTDSENARKLVVTILKGGQSILSLAAEVETRLRSNAAEGTPRFLLADRLGAITKATWSGLLNETADDVNDRWSDVRVTLASATTPGAFQSAFGPSGPFGTFRKDYLDDLFDGPELLPKKEILGARLVVTPGLRQTVKQAASLSSGLFDETGNIRSDRVVLDLQLGGSSAQTLVVEYQPKAGQTETSPKYINGPQVTFGFTWSPLTCQEFRFTVGFGPGNEPKTHRWTGPWAVADAFRSARQEGSKYIWPKTPGEWKNDAGQEYEVWLVMMPSSERRLLDFYPGGNVQSPMKALTDALPAKAVQVEDGRR